MRFWEASVYVMFRIWLMMRSHLKRYVNGHIPEANHLKVESKKRRFWWQHGKKKICILFEELQKDPITLCWEMFLCMRYFFNNEMKILKRLMNALCSFLVFLWCHLFSRTLPCFWNCAFVLLFQNTFSAPPLSPWSLQRTQCPGNMGICDGLRSATVT